MSIRNNTMARLRASALSLILIYAVFQYAGLQFSAKREYFPFFSWSLFTKVRKDVFRSTIEITRVGDTVYDPPVGYYDLPDVFPLAQERDSGLLKSVGNMSKAAERPDAADTYREVEEALITTYFAIPEPVEFQIVRIRINPMRHWRTGEVTESVVMSEHSTEGAQ